jgi:hypothetical protein
MIFLLEDFLFKKNWKEKPANQIVAFSSEKLSKLQLTTLITLDFARLLLCSLIAINCLPHAGH